RARARRPRVPPWTNSRPPRGPPPPTRAPPAGPPRRNILAAILATIFGGIVGLFPVAAGLFVFLDPLLKRKSAGKSEGESTHTSRRVASLAALPPDGTPVQVPVIADLTDAWSPGPS